MTAVLRDNWKYYSGAVVLHGAFAALLLVSINFTRPEAPTPQFAIKATLVDKSLLRQLERPQPDPQAEARKAAEEAEKKRVQEEESQRQRQQEQEQRETEQTLQREAEQREIDKQKQLEVQREAEAKQRQEAEEKQRQKQAAEDKRIAEIKEKQRQAEERKRTDAEAKAQAQREAELKAQLASEEGETQAVSSGLQSQYVAMIQQKVIRNWIKPASAKPGLLCEVKVSQTTNGTVLSAQVGQCNGDAAVRQSIESAVLSSSPLPAPPDPRVFQRNIVFNFKPVE